jgi:hypothetical protein
VATNVVAAMGGIAVKNDSAQTKNDIAQTENNGTQVPTVPHPMLSDKAREWLILVGFVVLVVSILSLGAIVLYLSAWAAVAFAIGSVVGLALFLRHP